MYRYLWLALLIAAVFSWSAAAQRTVQGEVVEVLDAKTVVIQNVSTKSTVELQYIAVPTEGQPMSDTVTNHLKKLVLGKQVEYTAKMLSYPYSVGLLTVDEIDISQQMLRDGAAWLLPLSLSGQDASDNRIYKAAESAAKTEKRGIWNVAGLKPPWEVEETTVAAKAPPKIKTKWGDKNPRLGDVGALSHGYNAASRTGYLSTTPLGVGLLEGFDLGIRKQDIDVTYIYRENDGPGRTGEFFITVVTGGRKCLHATNNDLVVLSGYNPVITVGKPKRSSFNEGELCWEQLVYKISRPNLERMVNLQGSGFKVGNEYIYATTFPLLLLHNMLQVSQ